MIPAGIGSRQDNMTGACMMTMMTVAYTIGSHLGNTTGNAMPSASSKYAVPAASTLYSRSGNGMLTTYGADSKLKDNFVPAHDLNIDFGRDLKNVVAHTKAPESQRARLTTWHRIPRLRQFQRTSIMWRNIIEFYRNNTTRKFRETSKPIS